VSGAEAANGMASAEAVRPSGPRPPDFELDALDGSSVRLSDRLSNQVVLIDFWATFCDPCLAAMPHLEELYQKHRGRGFLVLGISIDGPESLAQVRTQVSKTGVTFPILLDTESTVIARYNPRTSAPFSVLIGRDGRILKKQEGYTTGSGRNLEADIEQALGP
jgi:peroxiredoxin